MVSAFDVRAYQVHMRLEGHFVEKLGYLSTCAAAATIWISHGFNVGFQALTPTQLFSVIAAIAAVSKLLLYPNQYPANVVRSLAALFACSLAMIAVGLASAADAASPSDAVRFASRWIYGPCFVMACVSFGGRSQSSFERIIQSFMLGGAATSIVVVAGYFNQSIAVLVFQDLYSYRAQGFTLHPNQLGMIALASFILYLSFQKRSAINAICAISAAFLVVSSGSKFNMGLAVLFFPSLLFLIPYKEGRYIKSFGSAILGIVMAAAGVGAVFIILRIFNPYYLEKIYQTFEEGGESESASDRFEAWEKAWECGASEPFLGIGGGNANLCVGYSHAHNVFFNYFMEVGLTGLSILLVFLSVCVLILKRSFLIGSAAFFSNLLLGGVRNPLVVAGSFWAYLIANMSSDSLGPQTMPILWMTIGLALTSVAMSSRLILASQIAVCHDKT